MNKRFVKTVAALATAVTSLVLIGGAASAASNGSPYSPYDSTNIQLNAQSNSVNAYHRTDDASFLSGIFDQYSGPTDEMVNDGARDLTLNKPNRIGYVYVYDNVGTVMAYYTIKGKVSATTSQLSESQDVVNDSHCISGAGGDGGYATGPCAAVVDSPGDDETYGGEEGGPNGVFFFTTGGSLVELGGNVSWFYSDTPLGLTNKPSIIVNSNAAPTSGKASGTP
jgi:hypothetical protein